jgi:protein ImuA
VALAAHLVTAGQIERRDRRGRLPSGAAALDALIGGGWPRAALSELAGGRSTGRTATLLSTLGEALRRGETVALVDVGGSLDPRSAARAGMLLSRFLWIRCGVEQALGAVEIVVAAGGFALVALDLGEQRPHGGKVRTPGAAWQRLKRAAEQQGTAVLLASSQRLPGALGACAVTLSSARARWDGRASAPPLLLGLDSRASVERGGDAAAELSFTHEHGAPRE